MAVDTAVSRDVLDVLWAHVEPYAYITRETWEQGLADWHVVGVTVDDKLAFVVMTKGPEIHYISLGGAPLSLALLRRWGTPLLKQYGYVITRTAKDDARQQRVNRRMGAVVVGEDEHFIHFKWDK